MKKYDITTDVMQDCMGCESPYAVLYVDPFVSEGIRKPRHDWGEDDNGRSPMCHDCYWSIYDET